MGDNQIRLYPSNWLYNAGVIGFLKVLEKCGENAEDFLNDDGTVKVENRIFENIKVKNKELPLILKYYVEYLVNDDDLEIWLNDKTNRDKYAEFEVELGYFGYKFIRAGNLLFSSKTIYQNLVQHSEWRTMEFAKIISELKEYPKMHSEIRCGLCSKDKVPNPKKDSKLKSRLFLFQEPHVRILGPSLGEFPNAFWNLDNSIPICPLCTYLIIHHHIPFENAVAQEGQIFINAPSFKIMWYLNKFAEKVLTKSKEHQLRKILALSLMEFAQRVSFTLGAWSIMNIEMVIKKYNKIDYYFLPYEIAKVLLQKDVATFIAETKEPVVLETVLNGKFDYLITLTHKILRSLASGSDASKDNSLSELKNRDTSNLRKLSIILPELYAKIDSTIKKG